MLSRINFLIVLNLFIAFGHGAILKSQFLNVFRTQRERNLFLGRFAPRLQLVYDTADELYEFDPNCISVHRTNSEFFEGCQLPANCSKPVIHVLSKNVLGQETILCTSFHERSDLVNSYFEISFEPFNYTVRNPAQLEGYPLFTELRNVRTASFFEHFFLVLRGNEFSLTPKLCMSHVRQRNDTLPPSVTLEQEHDTACFSRVHYDNHDCELNFFKDLRSLLSYYNFPISFDGAPFSQSTYEETLNEGIGALQYKVAHASEIPFHVINKIGNVFVVTYSELSSPEPYFLVKSFVEPRFDRTCFPLLSKYSSPISGFFSYFRKFFHDELESLKLFLSSSLPSFARKLFSYLRLEIVETLGKISSLIENLPNTPFYKKVSARLSSFFSEISASIEEIVPRIYSKIINFTYYEMKKFFDSLRKIIPIILDYLSDLILQILSYVISLFPQYDSFLTSLFVSFWFYVALRDFLISFIVLIFSYSFQIYTDNFYK